MNTQILDSHKSLVILQQAWLKSLEERQAYPLLQKDMIQELTHSTRIKRIFMIWEKKYDSYGSSALSKLDVNNWHTRAKNHMIALQNSHGQMLGLLFAYLTQTISLPHLFSALCIYNADHINFEIYPCDINQIQPGDHVLLKAYSGQLAGIWNHPQWASTPYLQHQFAQASIQTQIQLHLITHQIQSLKQKDSYDQSSLIQHQMAVLRKERKHLSQALTQKMYESCIFYNHIGEQENLQNLWPKAPMGTGDCCAPKLLVLAAKLQIQIVGLTEFWWHPQKQDHKRYRYGQAVLPCQDRCMPLMPFLLKGL